MAGRSLESFIGQLVTVEQTEYIFCTEEDHPPHTFSVSKTTTTLELASHEPDLAIVGVIRGQGIPHCGEEISIPFVQYSSASDGGAKWLVISRIASGSESVLTGRVEFNHQKGGLEYIMSYT